MYLILLKMEKYNSPSRSLSLLLISALMSGDNFSHPNSFLRIYSVAIKALFLSTPHKTKKFQISSRHAISSFKANSLFL